MRALLTRVFGFAAALSIVAGVMLSPLAAPCHAGASMPADDVPPCCDTMGLTGAAGCGLACQPGTLSSAAGLPPRASEYRAWPVAGPVALSGVATRPALPPPRWDDGVDRLIQQRSIRS